MVKHIGLILTLCLFLASCSVPPAPANPPPAPVMENTSTPVPVKDTQTVIPVPTETMPLTFPDAFEATRLLGRGVNMGNALEADPNEGDWGVVIQEKYFDLIKEAGFNSVRIPTRWSTHASDVAPYQIADPFFARVDQVVNWALDRELVVILNVHHYEPQTITMTENVERFDAIWRQIANHYKDYPSSLIFEMYNEPDNSISDSLWNEISNKTLAKIRESNPQRNIIIGGVNWNSFDQLKNLNLPENDDHIIATFHYYSPFQFTHQGAEWVDGSNAWMGTSWKANDAEKTEIISHFDEVASWSREHNIPVLLGEFGAYSKADIKSRATWTNFIAREAEKRGFAWSYWEFCAGFGVYDRDKSQWNEPILRVLIP